MTPAYYVPAEVKRAVVAEMADWLEGRRFGVSGFEIRGFDGRHVSRRPVRLTISVQRDYEGDA